MKISNNKFLLLFLLLTLLFIGNVLGQDIEDDEYVPEEKIKEELEAAKAAEAAAAAAKNIPLSKEQEVDDEEPIPLNFPTRGNFLSYFQFKNPRLEFCLFSAFAFYITIVIIGKRKNEKMAKEWLICTYPLWKENFAELGIDEPSTLVRDGNHEFWYYATGRRFCKSVFTRVKLLPRQDILLSLYNIYKPNHDKIVMEAELNKEDSDDFVFALMDRKLEKDIKSKRYDLKTFPRRYKGRNAPNQIDYTVLTDAFEFAEKFFDNTQIKHALQLSLGQLNTNPISMTNTPWIESIIITDQSTSEPDIEKIVSENPPPPPKKTLTITVRIPKELATDPKDKNVVEIVRELTNLMFYLIDFIGEHGKLSNDTKSKLKKIRDNIKASINHQIEEKNKKELVKKKIEKQRARENEVSKMSAEKQKKYEEKMRKQQLKREQKKKQKKGKLIVSA